MFNSILNFNSYLLIIVILTPLIGALALLFIKEIKVDSAGMLKRIRPAPQGRAHRIRKRSNHVTMVLDNLNKINN